MNAKETITAATKRLDQVRQTLGHMMLGEEPSELYIRCDDDFDDDGNLFAFGLSVSGVDSDAEINEAFVTLHRTIDAQIAILRQALEDLEPLPSGARLPDDAVQRELDLATVILEAAS